MPPRVKITEKMVIDAVFEVAHEQGSVYHNHIIFLLICKYHSKHFIRI